MTIHNCRRVLILVLSLALAPLAAAAQQADPQQDPHKLVEDTTSRVLDLIDRGKKYFDEDPERFYNEVTTILDEVVDFRSFARAVMGPYGSKQRYLSLDSKAEREHMKEQIYTFADVFKEGLVQTYAKGLLAFNGGKVEVVRDDEKEDYGDSAIVTQKIFGSDDKPHVVQYKLRKNKRGAWKVRNVTIDGINLGQTYSNQFAAAAKQHDGDVDKVIANWSVQPETGEAPGLDEAGADDQSADEQGQSGADEGAAARG